MKLRKLLEEKLSLDDLIKIIKKRLPKAKNVRKKDDQVIITYKDHKFLIDEWFGVDGWDQLRINPTDEIENLENEIRDLLETPNIEEVKKLTKKIKNTATKLPKKKFKL